MHALRVAVLTMLAASVLLACGRGPDKAQQAVNLVSCNEAAFLEPHLKRFAKEEGFALDIRYLPPQDLAQELAQAIKADAVLAPSAEWLALAPAKVLSAASPTPVMTLPVALAVRQGLAKELGLEQSGAAAADVARLAGQGKLSFLLSSPSQSAAGLAVYLGMVRALTGKTGDVSAMEIDPAEAQEALKQFFQGVSRSSGSHLWVKSLFETGAYPAMFNYLHVLNQSSQDQERDGGEPLALIPVIGADMACVPVLATVEKASPEARRCVDKMAAFLLSERVQAQLVAQGRKPPPASAPTVVNRHNLAGLFSFYQERLRKPSITVIVAEMSGRMKGFAEREVKRAVRAALDPGALGARFLQPGPKDQSYLLVYNERVVKSWRLDNLSEDQQRQLLAQMDNLAPQGKANAYTALAEAGALLAKQNLSQNLAQVILIGYEAPSAPGKTLAQVKQQWQGLRKEAPVQCVLFGEMPPAKLDEIAEATRGRIFDGRTDLARAVFAARAYND